MSGDSEPSASESTSGSTLTNGWDAVLAMNAAQVNGLLFQQYVADRPTDAAAPLRALFRSGATHWLLDVTPGPPDIAFRTGLGPQQLEVSMFLVKGRLVRLDLEHQIIESAVALQTNQSQITGTSSLTKVTGTADQLGHVVLDLGTGAYRPRIESVDPDSALATDIGLALQAFFASNGTTYPLGTIVQGGVPACLEPTDFSIVTQAGKPDSGDGAVLLLIKTNGAGGSVSPLLESSVFEGAAAALVVSSRVLFDGLLPPFLTTQFQDIQVNGRSIGTQFAGQQAGGVWRTVAVGGAIDLGVLGNPNGDAYSSDDQLDARPVRIPLDNLTVAPDGSGLLARWSHSWDQGFTRVKHFQDRHGNPAEEPIYGSNRIDASYRLAGDARVDPSTDVVSFAGSGVVGFHADAPSWWSEIFEFNSAIPSQFKSVLHDALQQIFGDFQLPGVDTFAIANLLFPSRQALDLDQATVPGDLILTGEVRTALSLHPSKATVPPEGTQHFTVTMTGDRLEISPGTASLSRFGQSQQFVATMAGVAVEVSWRIVSLGNASGSVDDSGLYTPPPGQLAEAVVVATTTGSPAISAFAFVTASDMGLGPVDPDPVAIAPDTITLRPGQTVRLQASARNTSDIAWRLWPPDAGTLSTLRHDPSQATYTAPASADAFTPVLVLVGRGWDFSVAIARIAIAAPALAEVPLAPGLLTWTASSGSIDGATGLYTAPSRIREAEGVIVRAILNSDPSLLASGLVLVADPPLPADLVISPTRLTLTAGQSFGLMVTDTSGQPVQATLASSPADGTIAPGPALGSWVYSAPAAVASATLVTLTATSVDSSHTTTSTVQLLPTGSVAIAALTPRIVYREADGNICQLRPDFALPGALSTLGPGGSLRLTGSSNQLDHLTWVASPSDAGTVVATSDDGTHAIFTASARAGAAAQDIIVAAYGLDQVAGIGLAHLALAMAPPDPVWRWENLTAGASTASSHAPLAAGRPGLVDWENAWQVFYRGQNGHVCLITVSSDGSSWIDVTQQSSAQTLAVGDPMGYGWAMDPAGPSLHLLYVGADGHLHEAALSDGAGWTDTAVTAGFAAGQLPDGPPAAVVWDDDPQGASENAFYRGRDGHIYALSSIESGTAWQVTDLTSTTQDNATPEGDPAAFVWDQDPRCGTSLHVAYRDSLASVHEFRCENGVWSVDDLTFLTNSSSAPADGDPAGVAWNSEPGGSTIHWFYCGSDGRVRELWRGGGNWSFNDLSTMTGGVGDAAAGRLTAFVWNGDPRYGSTLHVTFRGQDGDLHDLWFHQWAWAVADLTVLAGAPRVAAD